MHMNKYIFGIVILIAIFMGGVITTTIGKILIVPFLMFLYYAMTRECKPTRKEQ